MHATKVIRHAGSACTRIHTCWPAGVLCSTTAIYCLHNQMSTSLLCSLVTNKACTFAVTLHSTHIQCRLEPSSALSLKSHALSGNTVRLFSCAGKFSAGVIKEFHHKQALHAWQARMIYRTLMQGTAAVTGVAIDRRFKEFRRTKQPDDATTTRTSSERMIEDVSCIRTKQC